VQNKEVGIRKKEVRKRRRIFRIDFKLKEAKLKYGKKK
jgi:hypothetical protein